MSYLIKTDGNIVPKKGTVFTDNGTLLGYVTLGDSEFVNDFDVAYEYTGDLVNLTLYDLSEAFGSSAKLSELDGVLQLVLSSIRYRNS